MPTTDSPWHFLTALDGNSPDDRELLRLTRSYELGVVCDMVAASRVSLLYSMSGNGKTSLVNAGVVPEFRERGYAVFRTRPRPPWCTDDPARAFRMSALRDASLPFFTPSELHSLVVARGQMAEDTSGQGDELAVHLQRLAAKVERLVAADPGNQDFLSHMETKLDLPIPQFVEEIRRFLDPETHIVFICDQFEEMFVHFANSVALQTFAAEIGKMHRDASLKTHLLFSMREDWVGSMIEFRTELPDLFLNYFKLDPLRHSRCHTVLSRPLEKRAMHFDPAAAARIADDLAEAYSLNARSSVGGMQAPQTRDSDPFVEAPALQLVAERMWETRDDPGVQAFTRNHYERLTPAGSAVATGEPSGQDGSAASPAVRVLNGYLDGLLADLPGAGELTELRLDCLYLMTDTIRHRRAIGHHALLGELRKLRPQGLDLPEVGAEMLTAALGPLIADGLVRPVASADGTAQYELVHDFAVRAVVRRWRALERDRTAEQAIRRSDEERRRTVFAGLMQGEKAGLLLLLALIGLGGAVAALAVVRAITADSPWNFHWVAGTGVLLSVIFFTAALLALREKRAFSFWASIFFLFGGVVLQWSPSAQDSTSILLAILWVGLIGVPVTLCAALELLPGVADRPALDRVLRVLVAEIVDGWTGQLLAIGGVALLSVSDSSDAVAFMLFFGLLLAWMFVGALRLSRSNASLGGWVAGLRIEDAAGRPPSLWLAFGRQFLVLLWSALWIVAAFATQSAWTAAAVVVLSLAVSGVLAWRIRNHVGFYDLLLRFHASHEAGSGVRARRLPGALVAAPAALVLALFVRTEPARQTQSDFNALSKVGRAYAVSEDEYRKRTGKFTMDTWLLDRGERDYHDGTLVWVDSVGGLRLRVRYRGQRTECVVQLEPMEMIPACRKYPELAAGTLATTDTTAVLPTTDTVVTTTSVDTAMAMPDTFSGTTDTTHLDTAVQRRTP